MSDGSCHSRKRAQQRPEDGSNRVPGPVEAEHPTQPLRRHRVGKDRVAQRPAKPLPIQASDLPSKIKGQPTANAKSDSDTPVSA